MEMSSGTCARIERNFGAPVDALAATMDGTEGKGKKIGAVTYLHRLEAQDL
jgi:hypothetical protein